MIGAANCPVWLSAVGANSDVGFHGAGVAAIDVRGAVLKPEQVPHGCFTRGDRRGDVFKTMSCPGGTNLPRVSRSSYRSA